MSCLTKQVWENLTGNWQIFLAQPAQDDEQAEEHVQPVEGDEQAEEQVQPVEEEDQLDNFMIQ